MILFFALTARRRLGRTLAWLTALMALVLFAYALSSQYRIVVGRLEQMTAQDYVEGRVIVLARQHPHVARLSPLRGWDG